MAYGNIMFSTNEAELDGIFLHFNDNLIIRLESLNDLNNVIGQLIKIKDKIDRCKLA